jgi:hypothetical protein
MIKNEENVKETELNKKGSSRSARETIPSSMRRCVTKGSLVVYERHYGVNVWVNELMDALRREECLCLNCERLTDHSCVVAGMIYKLCKEHNLALAMTRCKNWKCKEV